MRASNATPCRLRRTTSGLALAVALAVASTAEAKDVWTSADGKSSLDVGGFYKGFGAGLVLPSGLVDGSAALAAAMDGARQTAPGLPPFEALPGEAGLSTHIARIQARLLWGEHLDFNAAWQVGASIASAAAFNSGAVLGGSPIGASATAARRLWDFDHVLAGGGSFLLQHDLDRLSVKLALHHLDIVVGRQVLSWGSGKLWNPTDQLSPFAPTDIDKEVRKGVDAVRVSIPVGTTGLLDTLWLPQRRAADQGGVVRGQLNVLGYDLSLSTAKYVSDLVFGADFSGDAGPLGIHGEAAYTLGISGWDAGPLRVDERFWRAVGGLEWKPASQLVLIAEYYFNGYGATQPEDYLAKLRSPRIARGEIFGGARHYLGLVASWGATDLLTLQGTALINLVDPSAMLVPVLEYSVEQNVLLRVGGFIPIGARPDPRALQSLTPADVLGQTAAFQQATATMGLRSEYGASAAGAFVQVAVYR